MSKLFIFILIINNFAYSNVRGSLILESFRLPSQKAIESGIKRIKNIFILELNDQIYSLFKEGKTMTCFLGFRTKKIPYAYQKNRADIRFDKYGLDFSGWSDGLEVINGRKSIQNTTRFNQIFLSFKELNYSSDYSFRGILPGYGTTQDSTINGFSISFINKGISFFEDYEGKRVKVTKIPKIWVLGDGGMTFIVEGDGNIIESEQNHCEF